LFRSCLIVLGAMGLGEVLVEVIYDLVQ